MDEESVKDSFHSAIVGYAMVGLSIVSNVPPSRGGIWIEMNKTHGLWIEKKPYGGSVVYVNED